MITPRINSRGSRKIASYVLNYFERLYNSSLLSHLNIVVFQSEALDLHPVNANFLKYSVQSAIRSKLSVVEYLML
jgi:hypothetical protein